MFAVAVLLPALVNAQGLPDPTRPPPAFIDPGAAGEGAAEDAGDSMSLQSILVSKRRRQAVIGGKVVKVGDMIGQAKVVRIAEDGVVLRTGKHYETLRLFPDIEKRTATKQKASPNAAANQQ